MRADGVVVTAGIGNDVRLTDMPCQGRIERIGRACSRGVPGPICTLNRNQPVRIGSLPSIDLRPRSFFGGFSAASGAKGRV
jgi:hypothetical protein